MKQAPLYPSDEKVYIFNQHFADDCFERDLNVHAVVAISRNSRFCLFVFKQPLEVFCKKIVLRNFAKFTGKHLYHSLFFNKV